MYVNEICAKGIFVTFPWWLKNVKSRSKIALFSNERHFEIWFPKKRTITFFWSKLSKLHKKDPILHVTTTFSLKTRGNKNKTWTHSTPLKDLAKRDENPSCASLLPSSSINYWLVSKNQTRVGADLTAPNWQIWKRVFLTCPCHKIYRDEAVGLKSCKYTWEITIIVKMGNLGQYRENLIFCQSLLNWSSNLKILLHMCDTYNCDYMKHSTFRFSLIDFQLNINFHSQFRVF